MSNGECPYYLRSSTYRQIKHNRHYDNNDCKFKTLFNLVEFFVYYLVKKKKKKQTISMT